MPRKRQRAILVASFLLLSLGLSVVGCAPSTPQQRLVGRWKGAPEVTEAVDSMVQQAAPGQEVNPLAQGAARFLGKALAKATMSVEIDLRSSGAVFLSGNTELLGLPGESDGEWTVVSANEDVAHLQFDIDDKTIGAKIVFRDPNEFRLKMEPAGAPAADQPVDAPAETPAQKPAAIVSDDNKSFRRRCNPPVPTAGIAQSLRQPAVAKPATTAKLRRGRRSEETAAGVDHFQTRTRGGGTLGR